MPLRSLIGWATAILILMVVAGFIHVVYGSTITVCAKDGWALQDTFVDLDDYAGKPILAMLDKAKVLRAMFACGTLKRPTFSSEADAEAGVSHGTATPALASQDAALSAYRAKMTKIVLSTYASVTFPMWKMAHPGKACPDSISELTEYRAGAPMDDLWGRTVKMLCGADLPAEATGIAFLSLGEDGIEGTRDDVKSWE